MDLSAYSKDILQSMQRAGQEVIECYRVLGKANANTVGELLRWQGEFVEWSHYPEGDVFDGGTFSQYYYHAHRGDWPEHGHFHIFMRQGGMPQGLDPVPNEGDSEWPSGNDSICHLVAISMDEFGYPTRLFTTNRWVTGETWYDANDAIVMLKNFLIDHTSPSWATNRWISAMAKLYRPQIEDLLLKRDETLKGWRHDHPKSDVFEDRNLEVTSHLEISVDDQIEAIRQALD